jgi:hypothetical protein
MAGSTSRAIRSGPFLAELRGEVPDTKRARSAMRSEVSHAQAAFVGVLEKSAFVMGSTICATVSRNGLLRRLTRSETFPDSQTAHALANDGDPNEPEEKHVTFEDMGNIIAKVKKARGKSAV